MIIERVYIRIEDPDYPFALGVLIPSIILNNVNKKWEKVETVSNNDVLNKQISLINFSIFLDCEKELTSIDEILGIKKELS